MVDKVPLNDVIVTFQTKIVSFPVYNTDVTFLDQITEYEDRGNFIEKITEYEDKGGFYE